MTRRERIAALAERAVAWNAISAEIDLGGPYADKRGYSLAANAYRVRVRVTYASTFQGGAGFTMSADFDARRLHGARACVLDIVRAILRAAPDVKEIPISGYYSPGVVVKCTGTY